MTETFTRTINPNPDPIVRTFTLEQVMQRIQRIELQQTVLSTQLAEAQADLQVIIESQNP